jgi:hypothetical protein
MPVAISGLICKYCILENGLVEFIIESDVGIICLKCVDYFKSLQVILYNVNFDFWFDSYISSTNKIMTKKTYTINQIHIKQV